MFKTTQIHITPDLKFIQTLCMVDMNRSSQIMRCRGSINQLFGQNNDPIMCS